MNARELPSSAPSPPAEQQASADDSAPRRFRVLMLGSFALERDGEMVDTSKWQRRVASLFKLLAAAPDHRRQRDEIVDILWPDAAPEAGAGNLRIVTHRLRLTLMGGKGAVATSPILSEAGWIGLNPAYGWEIDLQQFEQKARTAGDDPAVLEEALALYRGEPLVEERYEDWALPIREHLQRVWREAALHLAVLHQSHGAYDDAVEWLERVLERDPLDEEALRGLLTALYYAGNRATALQRYGQFEQLLAEELGVPPSAETMDLVQQLHAQFGEPVPVAPSAREGALPIGGFLGALPDGPLVAREEELERVSSVAEGGAGRLLFLTGERGAGKTRLAQEIMLRLRDRGFVVVTGRCFEEEQDVPLYPFVEALTTAYSAQRMLVTPHAIQLQVEKRWHYLAQLFPAFSGLRRVDAGPYRARESLRVDHAPGSPVVPVEDLSALDEEERHHLFLAVTSLLVAMADERPFALLLDDVQWADEESLRLVQHLARHTRGHRILLAGVYCDEGIDPEHPLGRTVRALLREGLVERVPVRRFSSEGTAAYIDATLGDMPAAEEFAEFVHRRSRGNPFYLDRMLQGLGGRYTLVRHIGAGGMGRVFEAVDGMTGDIVAVKIMFDRAEADPRALARFEQEGQVLAALEHPNIVRVYQVLLEEHASCIVMELLEGQTLGQIMRNERLSLSRVRHLGEQVAAALACAHARGIVHRDIKPDNIMVVGEGVKVMDFGIARLVRPKGPLTTMTSTGMTLGTPLYMAPEQIEARRVDGRADIYSLGAVLYEAVTGRPPFGGHDPLSIAFRHVHEVPEPPRVVNPELPDDWEALILKALAKDPAERYSSAAVLAEALARLGTEPSVVEDSGALPDTTAAASLSDMRAVASGGQIPGGRPTGAAEGMPRSGLSSSFRPDEDDGEGDVAAPVPGDVLQGDLNAPPAPWVQIPARDPGEPVASTRPPHPPWRIAAPALAAILALAIGAYLMFGRSASRKVAAPIPSPTLVASVPGQFHAPLGIGVDATGNVYVADRANSWVKKFSPQGKALMQIGSTPGNGSDELQGPTDVTVDSGGIILVADFDNGRIQEFSPSGNPINTLSHWSPNGRGGGEFDQFGSVTVDSQGNVYGTDVLHGRVVKLSRTNTVLLHFGQRGPGKFSAPTGIAVNGAGNIYVCDRDNNRVEKFSPTGRLILAWGKQGTGPGELQGPNGVAIGPRGNVYVADTKNNRIQEFSPTGQPLKEWTRLGGGLGTMNQPSGVNVDRNGNIYVTDYYNNRLIKLSSSGQPLWATNGVQVVRPT